MSHSDLKNAHAEQLRGAGEAVSGSDPAQQRNTGSNTHDLTSSAAPGADTTPSTIDEHELLTRARRYVPGWSQIPDEVWQHARIKPLLGGLSNTLFTISLPRYDPRLAQPGVSTLNTSTVESVFASSTDPSHTTCSTGTNSISSNQGDGRDLEYYKAWTNRRKVVVRMFGGAKFFKPEVEQVIARGVSQSGCFGERILHEWEHGRITDFLQGSSLPPPVFASQHMFFAVAHRMGQLHALPLKALVIQNYRSEGKDDEGPCSTSTDKKEEGQLASSTLAGSLSMADSTLPSGVPSEVMKVLEEIYSEPASKKYLRRWCRLAFETKLVRRLHDLEHSQLPQKQLAQQVLLSKVPTVESICSQAIEEVLGSPSNSSMTADESSIQSITARVLSRIRALTLSALEALTASDVSHIVQGKTATFEGSLADLFEPHFVFDRDRLASASDDISDVSIEHLEAGDRYLALISQLPALASNETHDFALPPKFIDWEKVPELPSPRLLTLQLALPQGEYSISSMLVLLRMLHPDGLKNEALWLSQRLDALNSPTKLCHNDLHAGNVMLEIPASAQTPSVQSTTVSATSTTTISRTTATGDATKTGGSSGIPPVVSGLTSLEISEQPNSKITTPPPGTGISAYESPRSSIPPSVHSQDVPKSVGTPFSTGVEGDGESDSLKSPDRQSEDPSLQSFSHFFASPDAGHRSNLDSYQDSGDQQDSEGSSSSASSDDATQKCLPSMHDFFAQQLNKPLVNPCHLIDFEYSSPNFRGYDIGNTFCETAIEYGGPYPGFRIDLEQSISLLLPRALRHQNSVSSTAQEVDQSLPLEAYSAREIFFVRSYLLGTRQAAIEIDEAARDVKPVEMTLAMGAHLARDVGSTVHRPWNDPKYVQRVLRESAWCTLSAHLQWAFWSISMADSGKITSFGYLEYAIMRMIVYYIRKDMLLRLFGDPVESKQ